MGDFGGCDENPISVFQNAKALNLCTELEIKIMRNAWIGSIMNHF